MDLPIFDITNIPNKCHMICGISGHNENNAWLNIEYLFKNITFSYSKNNTILFISNNSYITTLNEYHKKYYGNDYIHKIYDTLVFYVMQKDEPMQVFIPEERYTFCIEYGKLTLTYSNIMKLYNKVTNFSQFWNKDSDFSKRILNSLDDYTKFNYIGWCLNIIGILPKELNIEIMKICYDIMDNNRWNNYKDLEILYCVG